MKSYTFKYIREHTMFGNLDESTRNALVLVALLVLVCWLIFYMPKLLHLEKFYQRSFRDWPDQPLGTAARQARISRGFNEPIDPSLPDPYLAGVLDISAQENSWTAADWSATK
jgi:hypothetical protein